MKSLFARRISVPNPLWWIVAAWLYPYRRIKGRLMRLFPRAPVKNFCSHCGADVGESLWGWCSIRCLDAQTNKGQNDPFHTPNFRV